MTDARYATDLVIERLHNAATDDHDADVLERLFIASGVMWQCHRRRLGGTGSECLWVNRDYELTCGACRREREGS